MKHIFLINPAAGSRGRQAELAGVCRKAALEQNLEYEILVTEHPGHGVELVRKACLQGGGQHLRFYACGMTGVILDLCRRKDVDYKQLSVQLAELLSGNLI